MKGFGTRGKLTWSTCSAIFRIRIDASVCEAKSCLTTSLSQAFSHSLSEPFVTVISVYELGEFFTTNQFAFLSTQFRKFLVMEGHITSPRLLGDFRIFLIRILKTNE